MANILKLIFLLGMIFAAAYAAISDTQEIRKVTAERDTARAQADSAIKTARNAITLIEPYRKQRDSLLVIVHAQDSIITKLRARP